MGRNAGWAVRPWFTSSIGELSRPHMLRQLRQFWRLYYFGALSNCGLMPLNIGTRSWNNPVNAEVRRQIIAMRRCGAGSENGTRLTPGEFGAGACTESAGISVTPTLALTMCRNVSRLVARKPGFSAAPVIAQTSSAWSRRQCPSSSSRRLSSARSASFTRLAFASR